MSVVDLLVALNRVSLDKLNLRGNMMKHTYEVIYWCDFYMEEKSTYVKAKSENEACDLMDAKGYETIAALAV